MALTYYMVVSPTGVQLPNGRVAKDRDIVRLESTNASVAAFVTAGVLVVGPDFSTFEPPLLEGTVFTGRAKPPELRPGSSEGLHNLVDPEDLKTHISPSDFTQVIADNA